MRLYDYYQSEPEEEEQQQTSKKNLPKNLIKKPPKKAAKVGFNKLNKLVNKKNPDINRELFNKHFNFPMLNDTLKAVYITNDRRKNDDLANLITSGLNDFKNEIEKMSEEEKEIGKPNQIVDIVKKFLAFNDRTQREQGLKILTPNQMLSRLPISLAQLKAGNNSEKRKNEIRQILYSLHRSKKLTKTIYNNLNNTI